MNDLKVTLDYIPSNCVEERVVEISSMSITYSQPADTNSEKDEYQFLTISTQDSGAGLYFDLKIDTKWSINDSKDLQYLIEDFENRLNLNITPGENLKTFERLAN